MSKEDTLSLFDFSRMKLEEITYLIIAIHLTVFITTTTTTVSSKFVG